MDLLTSSKFSEKSNQLFPQWTWFLLSLLYEIRISGFHYIPWCWCSLFSTCRSIFLCLVCYVGFAFANRCMKILFFKMKTHIHRTTLRIWWMILPTEGTFYGIFFGMLWGQNFLYIWKVTNVTWNDHIEISYTWYVFILCDALIFMLVLLKQLTFLDIFVVLLWYLVYKE